MNKKTITMGSLFRDTDTGRVETYETWVKQKGVQNTNNLISFGFFVKLDKSENGKRG